MHCTFFRGNQFSSFLPARTAALEAKRSGSPGCTALFFKGTTFPHSLCFTDAVGRTRLSPAVLPLALRRKEIAEFWQYGKRARRCSDSFRQHPDAIFTKVAEEMAPISEMPNSQWIKPHKPCAGRVCRDRIIGKHDLAQLASASLKRSIAFHCSNTICDHEVNRNRRADVENAFVNSAPVQQILRPALLHARHNAEHILQAEGDPCPMVRLHLGH